MSKLEELGWSAYFAAQLAECDARGQDVGRIVDERRDLWLLRGEHGEVLGELSGRLRHTALGRDELPAVGDWVLVQPRPEAGRATIHGVLARRTKLSRRAAGRETVEQILAANVDTIFVVQSMNRDLNLRRLERYLAMVWESGAHPVVLLSKSDLCADAVPAIGPVQEVAVGVPVHAVSAVAGQGLEVLAPYIGRGQTVALVGSSGVGKSTLINRLAGAPLQRAEEIRAGDDRGRHTTTSRQLILLPGGGMIIDAPGMRQLQLWDAEDGLSRAFEEIDVLAARCRFVDCRHVREPHCAVVEALESGQLDAERLQSYRKLQRELEHLARKQDPLLRFTEQKRLKRIHKAQKRRGGRP